MLKKLLFIFILLFGSVSCVKESFNTQYKNRDGYQTITFSNKDFESIAITTRSTLSLYAEKRILNLEIILFNSDGDQVIYEHYFSPTERVLSQAEMLEHTHCWFVEEEEEEEETIGTIRIKAPDITNGKLYLFANFDEELYDVSTHRLAFTRTIDDLKNVVASYQYNTIKRMSGCMMVGYADGITISNGEITESHNVELERIDSKINFNIRIAPGAKTTRNGISQEIEDFEPISWQVLRLPKSCNLIEDTNDAAPTDSENFFDSDVFAFETSKIEFFPKFVNGQANGPNTPCAVDGFSFYMLENRQSTNINKSIDHSNDFALEENPFYRRDKRNKNDKGKYTSGENGEIWEYAPEYATYVKIQGNIKMHYSEVTTDSQTLHALATYYIHLGDFGVGEMDNYDIERNTHYTYNVVIHGVDKIQVEVEKDNDGTAWNETKEEQSGATGEVFVSQEEIYMFDAHYNQKVFCFNVEGMLGQSGGDVDKLTWFVNTPFGITGSPEKVGTDKIDVVTGRDYKWVHFLVNSKEQSYVEAHGNINGSAKTIENTYFPNYCRLNRAWPGNGDKDLMNVVQFCDYLRKQIRAYNTEMQKSEIERNTNNYDFDSEGNIYVTVFVDEYYYDVDPTSGESRTALWHEFVNKPMRTMHIMCNSDMSVDGESSMIKSAVSIRQLSIQTIYNTDTALNGWGSETEDEFEGDAFFFNRDTERKINNWTSSNNHKFEGTPLNTSKKNGLYNSGHLWGLLDENNNYVTTKTWSEHIDYSQTNKTNLLKDNPISQTLRYACLTRNRDENGNGFIDKDEIKWYAASVNQLQELYLGELGLTGAARLYNLKDPGADNLSAKDKNNDNYFTWRNHVVSSTASNENPGESGGGYRPLFIWSEEGPSVSQYGFDNVWNKPGIYSIRCVRNLFAIKNDSHNMEDETDVPDSIVQVDSLTLDNNTKVYTFDMSRMNNLSKRPKVSDSLFPLDEKSDMSLLSNGFVTGDKVKEGNNIKQYSIYDYNEILKPNLEKGLDPCPQGYRIPNIREMSVLFVYLPNLLGDTYHIVCNYYSLGILGKGYDLDTSSKKVPYYSWAIKNSNITIDPNSDNPIKKNLQIRCVKDL